MPSLMVLVDVAERRCGLDPAHTIVHAVVVVQAVQAERKLVCGSDTKAVVGGDAALVDGAAGGIVVRFGDHGVDAQASVFASLDVEVAGDAAVVVAAQRGGHFIFGNGARLFAGLVDRAARRATAKQHGSGAAQQLQSRSLLKVSRS